MFRLVVILGNPFAHFASGQPHHSVLIGVVIRRTMKDRHPQRAFLQQRVVPIQGLLHQKTQQVGVALAVAE
jgi:hypothetical protein